MSERAASPIEGSNYEAALHALGMTPQEQYLYQHHLSNLHGTGKVMQPDGSISSVLQATVTVGGRTYNIPTVWGGRVLPPRQAAAMAAQAGWQNWPSYRTQKEAQRRYDKMHDYMERDTSDYLKAMKKGQ